MNVKPFAKKLAVAAAILGTLGVLANASSSRFAPFESPAARGKYLVEAIGCADCHTPLKLGPNGPERDASRMFSGHPQDLALPPAPKLPPGPWIVSGSASLTAWSGPWGTSFTANLTPDAETGIGTWTADQFVETIRTRRHLGRGRELLPPMPAEFYANLSDEDLRAVFAYLRTIPAVRNRVPQPLPPATTD